MTGYYYPHRATDDLPTVILTFARNTPKPSHQALCLALATWPYLLHASSTMATNPPPNPPPSQSQQTTNIITALGNAFKTQGGEPLPGEHIAQLLIANMSQLGELAKQGKLTQQQIAQVLVLTNSIHPFNRIPSPRMSLVVKFQSTPS